MSRSSERADYVVKLAIFTLAYLATAMVSVVIQSGHNGITPIWPPSGIALFAFYRYGLRMWPVVAIGIALLDWQIGVPPLSAAMVIAGNISEAWLGSIFIRRFDIQIGQRFKDVLKFVLLPTLVAPLSAASVGTLAMLLGGNGTLEDAHIMWFVWWIGDACGILLFTPLLYVWWRRPKKWSAGKRLFEWLIVITFPMLISWYTFYGEQVAQLQASGNLQFLVVPFLLWAAIRLGLRGTTLVSLIICGWVLWGAANNSGPFAMQSAVAVGLIESSVILVITLTGLVVQALFREHSLSMGKLRNAHQQLEERVKERTSDLEHSNERLRQEIRVKTQTENALNKSERQLHKAKQAAEKASESKTRFLAAASHDLRQPLQVITSITELLEVRNRDPELAEPIKQMARANLAMRELLGKLLDVSEVDAGKLTVKPTTFPIDKLLGELKELFQPIATDKGLDLKLIPCSAVVRSDPALVRVILQNLISNAVKYTARGRVVLGCRRRHRLLRVCVCDTGIGVSEEGQDVIFEEFYQLDNPARDRKQGSGFGLAIVQRVADLLKHPIYVRSVAGKGSCFAIDIPLSGRIKSVIDSQPDAGVAGSTTVARTLLLIDDDDSVLDANSMLLDRMGYQVIPASGAEAAINAMAPGLQQPEIIISDYRLPGTCTGTDLVKKLRSRAGRQIPAIILSGDLTLSDNSEPWPDRCLLVQKPAPVDRLTQAINQLLED